MTLLAAVPSHVRFVAFADHDDVWLPQKLQRACRSLAAVEPGTPALYCARQQIVGERLEPLGPSPMPMRPLGFANALVQNVATGCTAVLNRDACDLVLRYPPPTLTMHDWWSYIVVSGAGGTILYDPEPCLLYRQHRMNTIGARSSAFGRARRAITRGPAPFMRLLAEHLRALQERADLLTPESQAILAALSGVAASSSGVRLRMLHRSGVYRQRFAEDVGLWLWVLLAAAPDAKGDLLHLENLNPQDS